MDVTDEVMAVGPRIVRLYSLAIPAMGISMVCNYYFQSTLHRSASLVVSLLRGLVFPVIFVITIPLLFNHDYLWLATPIGEVLTCAIAVLLIIPMLRAIKDKKDERTTEEN